MVESAVCSVRRSSSLLDSNSYTSSILHFPWRVESNELCFIRVSGRSGDLPDVGEEAGV